MNTAPLKAIRQYCTWCMNGDCREIRHCKAIECPFHAVRSGHNAPRGFSRLKAIRAKCKDCAETRTTIRDCIEPKCPIHHLRMGKNPNIDATDRSGNFKGSA